MAISVEPGEGHGGGLWQAHSVELLEEKDSQSLGLASNSNDMTLRQAAGCGSVICKTTTLAQSVVAL